MSKSNELTKTAGAFDIRNVIGVLLGIFGIILVIAGLAGYTPDEAKHTGGIDANLWTGIGLVLAAIIFLVWAWLRPIHIIDTETSDSAAGNGDTAVGNGDTSA